MAPAAPIVLDSPAATGRERSRLGHRIKRAREVLRTSGVRGLLLLVVRRALLHRNPLLSAGQFHVCRLIHPRDVPVRLPYQVALATATDTDQMVRELPEQSRAISDRWSRGQQCLVVKSGETIVGSVWLVTGLPDVRTAYGWPFRMPAPGGIWCHNNYVHSDHRLRGAFLAGMRGMWDFAQSVGGLPLYGVIDARNEVSLRAHRSAGWEVFATVRFLVVLGFRFFLAQSAGGGVRMSVRFAPILRGRHLV